MCKPGNQTVYRCCWEVLREMGVTKNQDIQRVLRQNGGCMVNSVVKLDKKEVVVVK